MAYNYQTSRCKKEEIINKELMLIEIEIERICSVNNEWFEMIYEMLQWYDNVNEFSNLDDQ